MNVAGQLLFPAGAEELVARHWLERLDLSGLEQRLPAAAVAWTAAARGVGESPRSAG